MVDVSDEELSMVIIDEDDDDIDVDTIQTNNVQIVSSKPEVDNEQHDHENDNVSENGSSRPSSRVLADFFLKPVSFFISYLSHI